uniref:Conserved hypothethical protein n=1 Tax=Macrostomum lignano TaxID=282301 RepID=A0A1I8FFU0_9PLAT
MEPETSTASIEATAHWPDDNVTDFVTPSPSSDWSNETQCYIKLRLFGGLASQKIGMVAAPLARQLLSALGSEQFSLSIVRCIPDNGCGGPLMPYTRATVTIDGVCRDWGKRRATVLFNSGTALASR